MNRHLPVAEPSNGNANIFDSLTGSHDYDVAWRSVSKLRGHIRANMRFYTVGPNPVMGVQLTVMNARYTILDSVLVAKTLAPRKHTDLRQSPIFHPVRTEALDQLVNLAHG